MTSLHVLWCAVAPRNGPHKQSSKLHFCTPITTTTHAFRSDFQLIIPASTQSKSLSAILLPTQFPAETMSSKILSNRDTNAQLKPMPSPEKNDPKSLEYHRQMLQSRLKGEQ